MSFKPNFVWGAATSSYQIEGAARNEGRGLSVWDDFSRRHPGRVFENQNGDTACEHYQRSGEDVALMKQLGLQAYRFSISWPRVLPEGTGAVNEKGLAFYDRLVDQLLAAGIQPWATLFHWDFPITLYQRGGWLNADSPRWFADYARVITDRLSDRVTHWMTLNEPQCFIGLGHRTGEHAPGDRLEMPELLRAAQNVMLAHGLATQVIRTHAKTKARIGWAPTGDIAVPATHSTADIAAARESYWAIKPDGVWNQAWWMEPVMKGRYPEAGLRAYGNAVPPHTDEQMRTIAQPLDFFGMNIYNGYQVRAGADGHAERMPRPVGDALTHMGWHVTPPALYWGPRHVFERYGLPIVITENGMACHDWVHLDGQVHDASRIDYTARYLRELRRAARDGIVIDGYFHWTLMDNFEWAEGYGRRFGLVHVDYATQQRTLKDSAKWYAQVIRTNGGNIPE
jgi:beta-glucosidase